MEGEEAATGKDVADAEAARCECLALKSTRGDVVRAFVAVLGSPETAVWANEGVVVVALNRMLRLAGAAA